MMEIVPQQVPMQLGGHMGMGSNPMIQYQPGAINMSAVGYADPQITHGLGTEDVIGGAMQGIAFIPVYIVFFDLMSSQNQ